MARPAARPRPGDVVLPAVNALVRLNIGATADPDDDPVASNVPSRIEDVLPADPKAKGSRTQLFVALPHYPGDVAVPWPGTACTVTWVSPDGLYDLPTGFVERVCVGPTVYAWRVEVTGRAVRAQRRRYVRVVWAKPIVVDVVPVGRVHLDADGPVPVGDDRVAEDGAAEDPVVDHRAAEEMLSTGGGTLHGTTLDLSEGGVRCLLPPPQLRTGQPVRVHLDVAGNRLAPEGTVVRVEPWPPRPGAGRQYETGIAFTEPDEHGDLLRKVVFDEQLRARRSGVG